jgi:hypothetical protein
MTLLKTLWHFGVVDLNPSRNCVWNLFLMRVTACSIRTTKESLRLPKLKLIIRIYQEKDHVIRT